MEDGLRIYVFLCDLHFLPWPRWQEVKPEYSTMLQRKIPHRLVEMQGASSRGDVREKLEKENGTDPMIDMNMMTAGFIDERK